ncbi:MAG: tetratricopeptide repeat protein, partial [Planctomycetes bacterium]|nr:tetratricopeptide repeat protein [Planctomycetota bacterium]
MRATFLVALLFASALVPLASAAPESGSPTGGPGRVQWPALPPGKERVAEAFERGKTHFDRAEYDAALAAFRDALQEGPDCWQAELGAGMALACLDRNAEAVTSLTKIVQSQKEESGARMYRAWAFVKLGEFDRAVRDVDVLLSASPDDYWCHGTRGWCELQTGETDKALADFDAILERLPGDVMALIEKAEALALKGDKAEAVRILGGIPPDIQL